MNRVAIGVLFLAFLLGACGGSGESDSKSASKAPSVSLKVSCPKVEAALPTDVVPSPEQWTQVSEALAKIADEGDLETKNAIESLQRAVATFEAGPERGQEYVDAEDSLISSIQAVADRCKVVGSSALQ